MRGPYDSSMLRISVALVALVTACGVMGSASTLDVSASGVFSSSDTPDLPFLEPSDPFSISFDIASNAVPIGGTVTANSFDVAISNVSYALNGSPVSLTSAETPTEVEFDTLANGGLFTIIFGSGLDALEFSLQGAQAFSGTTSSPSFAPGSFTVSSGTFSDALNFDALAPQNLRASMSAVPEPSTVVPLVVLAALAGITSRKLRRAQ